MVNNIFESRIIRKTGSTCSTMNVGLEFILVYEARRFQASVVLSVVRAVVQLNAAFHSPEELAWVRQNFGRSSRTRDLADNRALSSSPFNSSNCSVRSKRYKETPM
jgi:hypothetical protein